MSGLFDTLAGRFAPDAVPEIRPRPLGRFEGAGEGGLFEIGIETRATRPDTAGPVPTMPDRRTSASNPTGTGDAEAGPPAPSASVPPAAAPRKAATQRPPAPPKPAATSAQEPIATSDGGDLASTGRSDAPRAEDDPGRRSLAAPAPDVTAPPVTRRTEIVEERIIRTAPPSQVPIDGASRPASGPARAESDRRAAEVDSRSEPTIRIGRIEVRQPPPAPAPHATPARPPQPVARRAEPVPARTAPSPSRLTDYLGWKR